MGNRSHGLRSENLREDAYWAEVDQMLLANLRETLQLQREAARCAAGSKCDQEGEKSESELSPACVG